MPTVHSIQNSSISGVYGARKVGGRAGATAPDDVSRKDLEDEQICKVHDVLAVLNSSKNSRFFRAGGVPKRRCSNCPFLLA